MRFNCGHSTSKKNKVKEDWHDWFAWYPVRVAEGDCRWLETVERKGELHYDFVAGDWKFEYREKNT